MQRDLKIGLSLAVLLIGVVGALFFRKDESQERDLPELKTAWEIDQQILHRKGNHVPYLAQAPNPHNSSDTVAQSTEKPSVIEPIVELASTESLTGSTNLSQDVNPTDERDVLPPTQKDQYLNDLNFTSEVNVATVNTPIPQTDDSPIEPPHSRSTSARIATVEAERTDTLSRRWTNAQNQEEVAVPGNLAWKTSASSANNSSAGSKLDSIPIPSASDDLIDAVPPSPKATRKLKPIPITENGKFNSPARTPFTLVPATGKRSETDRMNSTDELLRNRSERGSSPNPNGQRTSAAGSVYEVQAGDTLERIAYRHYGRRDMVDAILSENQDVITDRNFISIGMKLRLP